MTGKIIFLCGIISMLNFLPKGSIREPQTAEERQEIPTTTSPFSRRYGVFLMTLLEISGSHSQRRRHIGTFDGLMWLVYLNMLIG